ncbi:MAG: hypothetical protein JXO48_06875 [Deltaproteobacteria bacterium]|nr:hypothetical protein [Deltaproteobacteria bacterium]
MKKICVLVTLLFFCAAPAFGDVVQDGLSDQASERIMNGTRALIAAGMDEDAAVHLTQAMIGSHMSEELTLRAQGVLKDAASEGLPLEPIMNKAYEGMAKKVHADRVVRAMEAVRSRYAYAYEKVGLLVQERSHLRSAGDILADGLAAGLGPEDAQRLVTRLRDMKRDRTQEEVEALAEETFRTTRDMARAGVSSSLATETLMQALQHRFGVREMAMLRASFMRGIERSEPNRLAQNYAARIGRGEQAGSLDSSGSGSGKGTESSGGSGSGASGGTGGGSGSGNSGSDGGNSGGHGNGGSGKGSGRN